MLSIDVDQRVFYEGSSGGIGIPVWPSPFVTIATVVKSEEDFKTVPTQTDLWHAPLLFREDHFDPVTRIRRGRLYNYGGGSQPQTCSVQVHPALPSDTRSINQGVVKKTLHRFHDYAARVHLKTSARPVTVVLGVQDAMTLSIIAEELSLPQQHH